MKIIELELYLYRRLLSLRGIRKFKLTVVDVVQLILGTNGCGKSSVAREANMNPAERNDFLKGGYKKVVCEFNGETYTATSSFENGQKHSLIRMSDMKELNEGGTVTIQKELIYNIFGTTRDIREMLDGSIRFTNMSTALRREWLTRLCVVDYTFAINVYKKAQGKLKDANGYVRNLQLRLVTETAKLMTEEQIKVLRDRHSVLTKETQQLYLLRNANATSLGESASKSNRLKETVALLTAQYKTTRASLKEKFWMHPEALQESVDDCLSEVGRATAVYEQASAVYEELTKDGDVEVVITSEELQALMSRVIEIDELITKALQKRKLSLNYNDPVAANQALTSIFDDLRNIFLEIFENPDRKFNSERHKLIIEQHDKLLTSINVSEEKLGTLRHQVSHLDALAKKEEIECPECDHQWKIGYDAELHANLKNSMDTLVAYIEQRKKEFAAVQSDLNDSTKYMEHMKQIMQTMRYTPALQPLWDLFMQEDMIRQFPRQCATNLEIARNDLMFDLQAFALRQEFTQTQEKVRRAQETQTEAHAMKAKDIEKARVQIGFAAGNLHWARSKLLSAQQFLKDFNTAYDLASKIEKYLQEIDTCTKEAIEAIKNDIIDTTTGEAMGELAILAKELNQIELQTNIVEDIKKQIIKGEADAKAYNLLVKSLSPVDGIIAEGMLGFIRDFVARMNAFIAKIWTYPLEVKDCSMEENSAELNYRFPVIVNNDITDPKPDVSNGSEGMMEIIDLSFRMAAAQCLNLDTHPLVLDEFGRTFDETHREAATHVIRQIMEQLHYSQFFIISHYDATHGSFYKAQMTVIDKRNITIPAGREYNTHTVIES